MCVYSGAGGNVTLDVFDPGGATRQVQRTVTGEKTAALLTTSPDGGGFVPDPGWCDRSDDSTDPVAFG